MTVADPVTLAQSIADSLVASAVSDGDRATWLAPVVAEGSHRHVTLETGDATLYQGSAGIAWACAEAAAILGRDDLARVALDGVRGAIASAGAEPGPSVGSELGSGLYDGLTGIGLVALAVGSRLGDRDLAERGRDILDRAAAGPASGPELVRGEAGVIVGLLAADRIDGGHRWLPTAKRHGEALLAAAQRRSWGWAWPLPEMDEPALCGLAHGAAGIAWALGELEAAAADGTRPVDPSLAEGLAGALRFERSWFDHRRNTWPDLRAGQVEEGAPVPHPTLWCHGAVGIGLTRLRLDRLRPDPALLAEAASALQSSVAAAVGNEAGPPTAPPFGLTLCHGLGGTLELLLTAGEALGEEAHLATARWLFDRAVVELGTDVERWPSGVAGCEWAPSLMTGLAGTMLVLLRLAEPGRLAGIGLPFVDWTERSQPATVTA